MTDNASNGNNNILPLNEEQQAMVADLIASLQGTNPNISPEELIRRAILPALKGRPPRDWAGKHGFHIMEGSSYHSAAICVCWGIDPDATLADGTPNPNYGKALILFHLRDNNDPYGRPKYGMPGGFLEGKEQPYQAVMRETGEEFKDETGATVFTLFDDPDAQPPHMSSDRMVLLHAANIDPEALPDDEKAPPILYNAYAYEMDADEIRKMKAYVEKSKNPEWVERVSEHTDGETRGAALEPLVDLLMNDEIVDRFAFRNQYAAAVEVLRLHMLTRCRDAITRSHKEDEMRRNRKIDVLANSLKAEAGALALSMDAGLQEGLHPAAEMQIRQQMDSLKTHMLQLEDILPPESGLGSTLQDMRAARDVVLERWKEREQRRKSKSDNVRQT